VPGNVGTIAPGGIVSIVFALRPVFTVALTAVIGACGGQTKRPSSDATRDGELDGGLDGSAGGAGAALPLNCTGPNGDRVPVDGFALAWRDLPEPPRRSSHHRGGGFFAVGEQGVYVVSPAGTVQEFTLERPTNEAALLLVYPPSHAGNAFVVRWQDGWPTTHDTHGNCLGSIAPGVATSAEGMPLDLEQMSFSGSGNRVVAQAGVLGLESFLTEYVQLHSLDGQLLTAVPLGGIEADLEAAASDEAVFVKLGDRLTRYALDETLDWDLQFESPITSYVVSPDGSRLAVGLSNGWVAHVADGQITQLFEPEAPLGRLRLSPNGVFTVASSVNPVRLARFESGEDLTPLVPPLQAVHTLDVSDDGEIVAGGTDESEAAHVLLYSPDGGLRWDCRVPDAVAHVTVQFADAGRAVFAWYQGYYFYLLL